MNNKSSYKKKAYKKKPLPKPKSSIKSLQAKISKMEKELKPEKKTLVKFIQNARVAQLDGNTNGHYIIDITCNPIQGDMSTDRVGNEINHVTSFMHFQFYHQSATQAPMRLRIYLIRNIGAALSTVTGVPGTFFDANPFISGGSNIYDFNCVRNKDWLQTYKVVYQKEVSVKPDNVTSQTMITDVKLPVKYTDAWSKVKFYSDATATPASGQLFLFIVADSGNHSTTTSSTLSGVPVTAINTGVVMQYNIVHYFTDA